MDVAAPPAGCRLGQRQLPEADWVPRRRPLLVVAPDRVGRRCLAPLAVAEVVERLQSGVRCGGG